jgi:hypothetical protein
MSNTASQQTLRLPLKQVSLKRLIQKTSARIHQVPGELHMLNKCANPSCSTRLVYLREGKIFMMEQPQEAQPAGTLETKKSPPVRVEHFWLCGPCSAEMTLVYDRRAGVRVMPKTLKSERAAS